MRRRTLLFGLSSLALSTAIGPTDAHRQEPLSSLLLPPFGICPELSGSATSNICPALGVPVPVTNQSESDDHSTSNMPELSTSTASEQPLSAQSTAAEESASSSPWSRGALCRRVGQDDYCVFTHSTFNGGEGISVVTTPAIFLALGSQAPLSLPVSNTDTPTVVTPGELYRDVAFPGKGIGLVATEPIRADRRIMARNPALMVDDRAFRGLRGDDLAVLLAQAVIALPQDHRTRFLNLSSSHESGGDSQGPTITEVQLDLVYKIFTTNAFKTTVKLTHPEIASPSSSSTAAGPSDSPSQPRPSIIDFQSTFTEVSRLNHDCSPNLAYYFDDTTLSHKVYAVRDIMPGEELTVSYIDVLLPRATRQLLLQTTWHFTCTCQRCGGGTHSHPDDDDAHITAESDSRVAQLNALRRELDSSSHTTTGQPSPSGNTHPIVGTGTPSKALLLITLYQLEGAHVRIYEAYYRAALEYNGVGDAANALVYARKCLATGLVARGPERPFIESMKGLVEDPTRHWSWRFRVGTGGGGAVNGNGDGSSGGSGSTSGGSGEA